MTRRNPYIDHQYHLKTCILGIWFLLTEMYYNLWIRLKDRYGSINAVCVCGLRPNVSFISSFLKIKFLEFNRRQDGSPGNQVGAGKMQEDGKKTLGAIYAGPRRMAQLRGDLCPADDDDPDDKMI